jgi:putative hydrolase of the HAD superfamily
VRLVTKRLSGQRRGDEIPDALLLDLDDTILDDAGSANECWLVVAREWSSSVGIAPEDLCRAILQRRDWYWQDPERNRLGRHNLRLARHEVVGRALADLRVGGRRLAETIADAFSEQRDAYRKPFPGAVEALTTLNARGVRLGLITNGPALGQRAKLERFELTRYFEHILIEGEFGVGKPDERVYRSLLDALCVSCNQIWSIGDDLERDIAAPQRLGLYSVWVDAMGSGLPAGCPVAPDRTISGLAELVLD